MSESDEDQKVLEMLGNLRIRFWTCLNPAHNTVTWNGDVASCNTCGLTSEHTIEFAERVRENERKRLVADGALMPDEATALRALVESKQELLDELDAAASVEKIELIAEIEKWCSDVEAAIAEDEAWLQGPQVSVDEARSLPEVVRQTKGHVQGIRDILARRKESSS